MSDAASTTVDTGGAKVSRRPQKPRETPEEKARKLRQQILLGVLLFAGACAIGFYVQAQNPKGGFIWLIGLGFGYVLQRSRFCFTAAFRDPLLTGTTQLSKAVILALALASIGFMALQMKVVGLDLEKLPGLDFKAIPGNIHDVGLQTVLGGILFGMGAVIAGGCASGTLMRMGEAFAQQWIVIVFFIIGSVIGVQLLEPMKATGWLYTTTRVYTPELFGGWLPAIIVHVAILGGVYVLADWYGKKRAGEL